MAKLPAFQFYPGDWLKDPALRACSFAGRGLWMDMLCLMWESEERGVLASNGRVWTDEMILRACGVTSALQDAHLLSELLDLGVASRRDDGAIYCRRMVREEDSRTKTRLRVKKHRLAKPCNAKVTSDVTPMKHASSSSASAKKENTTCSPPLPPTGNKLSIPWKIACAAMSGDSLWTDAFREAWEAWADDRRERGKKLTTRAIAGQIKKLEAWGHDRAIASIEQSIGAGWTGLFEPKPSHPPVHPGQRSPSATAQRRAEKAAREYPEGHKPLPVRRGGE